jgi:RNase P/RNase MRP subunit p30
VVIDLGVYVPDSSSLEPSIKMAQKLGFTGLATPHTENASEHSFANSRFSVLKRADLTGNNLKSIRKRVDDVRGHSMIVAVDLTSVETANWAADDKRVDLLTLNHLRDYRLRDTTARLGATSNTALEIKFGPLLKLAGLSRSKVIKMYRESISTAIGSGMQVILSSGAEHPLHMRSPRAMQYLCELLGMEPKYAEHAVNQAPVDIVKRNRRRFSSDYIRDGLEIIQGGTKE